MSSSRASSLFSRRHALGALAALPLGAAHGPSRAAAPHTLLNVSYDVTREFYKDYDASFAAH